MQRIIFCFILTVCAVYVNGQSCPATYKRFSLQHTYCLPWNKECSRVNRKLSDNFKRHLLMVHNVYRSRLARRDISNTPLPTAANMLEMVWDDELETLAQKWADTCQRSDVKDCDLCRMSARFPVGQTTDEYDSMLEIQDLDLAFGLSYVAGLESVPKSLASKYEKGRASGRLTQLLWAKTWRVGCGWTLFKMGWRKRGYLVCNYGPAGNVVGEPMYKVGKPCSACPANTCCQDSCKKYGIKANYLSLCKVIDPKLPPEGTSKELNGNELFYCNFNGESDCRFKIDGTERWNISQTNGGSWISIFLNGGEQTTLNFDTPILSSSGKICFILVHRRGPTLANETDISDLTAQFQKKGRFSTFAIFDEAPEGLKYILSEGYFQPREFPRNTPVKISVTFSVPEGSVPHYLEIEKIIIREQVCPKSTAVQGSSVIAEGQ